LRPLGLVSSKYGYYQPMVTIGRSKLPLRQNCEGYFTDSKGNILAQASEHGYIIFPGGGVEANESPEAALVREALEETGATVRIAIYYIVTTGLLLPRELNL
jgi:hypothetical protein